MWHQNEQLPFGLLDHSSYSRWRDSKLDAYPTDLEALVVEIENPAALTAVEHAALLFRVKKTNMAIYACRSSEIADKAAIRTLGRQFGLERLDHNMYADDDAITTLKVRADAGQQGYIPYTDRPIAWHTDGYYNDIDHQILGLMLHSVRPAVNGGANQLLDHEILYLQLREQNPDYIQALMHPQAMTIPANVLNGEEIRPARTGPVFSLLPSGRLHMRYTDRSRSIQWRDDALTREAVAALKQRLKTDSPYHFEQILQPGQGLLCNNVLHTRRGFDQGESERLFYRARFYDRIEGS